MRAYLARLALGAWAWGQSRAQFGLVVGLVLYGGWFIYRGSFELHGERYFVLFDDGMVSMTYAKNVVDGHGLNWARFGEPVEGFSCPLWTLLMIPIHWLPLSDAHRPLVVQLISLGALAANVLLVHRLTREQLGASERGALFAAALTAIYFPLNCWALMGMETGLQALVVTGTILSALRRRPTALFVWCAVGALLRPDMALLVGACLLFFFAATDRPPWRIWLPRLLLLVVPVAAYAGFRGWYFHDVAPNTYYLKMTGVPVSVRVARGLTVFVDFVRPWGLLFFVSGFGVVALAFKRSVLRLPIAVVALYFMYSIYVGGDAWEHASVGANRFIAPVMPILFAAMACLADELIQWLQERNVPARVINTLGAATLAFIAIAVNGVTSDTQGSERLQSLLVLRPPLYTSDRKAILKATLALDQVAAPDAMVATVWAGIPAYYSSYRMADVLGYNDRTIARGRARGSASLANVERFVPGHMKWSYAHTLGVLQPDVVFQTWHLEGKALARTMEKYGYYKHDAVWLRVGSTRVKVAPPPKRPWSRLRGARSDPE